MGTFGFRDVYIVTFWLYPSGLQPCVGLPLMELHMTPRTSPCTPPANPGSAAVVAHASESSGGACIPPSSACLGGGSSIPYRPVSTLFEAVLGKDGFQTKVKRRTEYSKDAARFSLTLVGAVGQAYRVKSVGQFHKLLNSIQRGVAVYLAALVHDRDRGVLSASEFPLRSFYSLDDCLVILTRCDAFNQSDLHLRLSATDVQRLYYVRELLPTAFY